MKTAPLSALLPAALHAALPTTAAAFTEVARGALTLTTTGQVAYDSNVLGNSSERDDTVVTLSPTLNYNRSAGLGTIDASLGLVINRYLDLTELDNEDLLASFRIGLPTPEGARQAGAVTAGYTDRATIDESVGQRVRTKTWNAGVAHTYRAGPRTDLRADLRFADATRDIYADRTDWSAALGFDYSDFLGGFGLEGDYRYNDLSSSSYTVGTDTSLNQTSHQVSTGLFYRYVSGLRASADVGYRWIKRSRNETLAGSTSDNGLTFGLKLDGPFLPASRFPKLKSSYSLGYEKGQALGLNDQGSSKFVGNLALAWQARERTSLRLNASRSQDLGSDNYSRMISLVSVGVVQQIGHRTKLSASLAREWASYPGGLRTDHRTRASLSLLHTLNRRWQVGASYAATLSRSTFALQEYDRHLVSAFVTGTF